jgi:hypothetical protein
MENKRSFFPCTISNRDKLPETLALSSDLESFQKYIYYYSMFYSVSNLGHLRVFYYIQVSILGKFIGKLIKMANFDLLPDNLILYISTLFGALYEREIAR